MSDSRTPSAKRPSLWRALICVPWMLGAILALISARNDEAIAARQQTAVGKIVAHEPSNHNRFGYTFSVGGKSYRGWESPQRDGFQLGQEVVVYFDPTAPSTNALTDFAEQSADDTRPVALLILGSLGIVAAAVYEWRRGHLS